MSTTAQSDTRSALRSASTQVREERQLCLFENLETATRLEDLLWCHSFDRQISSLQPLAPYATKLKPSLVPALIDLYSQPGEVVLDPFAGSGTIPLEAAIAERQAWATDLNPYACALTRGKLAAPCSERLALQQAAVKLTAIEQIAPTIDLDTVPAWVQTFFHPETLREIIAGFQVLQSQPFFMACLLGILHHVLPGHLSYPTTQQAPYLRRGTYPPEQFPQLYGYRDLRSRLMAKIKRSYRQHRLPRSWEQRQFQVWQQDSAALPIATASVDAIISQPPHWGAIESSRDHRLRLWFLGCDPWQDLDAALITSHKTYAQQMAPCLQEMARVLKPGGYCILLLTDVAQQGKTRGIADLLATLAKTATDRPWSVETIYDYPLPLSPPQPSLKAVKFDRFLVLRKVNPS